MRNLFGVFFCIGWLFGLPAWADDCNCTAPGGGCSISITCPGHCWAICQGTMCTADCGPEPGSGPEKSARLAVKHTLQQPYPGPWATRVCHQLGIRLAEGKWMERPEWPAEETGFNGNWRVMDVLRQLASEPGLSIRVAGYPVTPFSPDKAADRMGICVTEMPGTELALFLFITCDLDLELPQNEVYSFCFDDITADELEWFLLDY